MIYMNPKLITSLKLTIRQIIYNINRDCLLNNGYDLSKSGTNVIILFSQSSDISDSNIRFFCNPYNISDIRYFKRTIFYFITSGVARFHPSRFYLP